LFSTLVIQLIHWFTNNVVHEDKETGELLDAAAAAAGSSSDGALREFGATCLAEFFTWSFKQQHQESATVNLDALIRRLYGMLSHPDPFQRLGGCLALNNMYRTLRENDNVIRILLLEILDKVINCLLLSESDDPSLGTREEAQRVLDNFRRIVCDEGPKKYLHLVNQASKLEKRRGGSNCKTLGLFATYLFESMGRPEEIYRRYCWHLFTSFAPLSDAKGNINLETWFTKYLSTGEKTLDSIVAVFESGGEMEKLGLLHPTWITEQKERKESPDANPKLFQALFDWLTSLSTALDCYYLFFDQTTGITPTMVFSSSRLALLTELSIFISHVMAEDNSTSAVESRLSSELRERLIHVKCTICIRLFRLVGLFSQKYSSFDGFDPLFSSHFFSLSFQSLLDPAALGFSAADGSRIRELQETVGGVFKSLAQNTSKTPELIRQMTAWLKKPNLGVRAFKHELLVSSAGFASTLASGYLHMHSAGLLKLNGNAFVVPLL